MDDVRHPMAHSSHELIERHRSGDRAALDELLARHLNSLHGFLRLRCGAALRGHESSMDLVQSVCHEVLANCGHFDYRGEPAFRQWLFQVAENKVRDRIRFWGRAKRDAQRELQGELSNEGVLSCYASFCTPSQNAIASEELERVEHAFGELDANYRDVILLSRVIGLSNEEIATQIGQSTHYTRTLLSRGLARLTTLLDRP